MVVPLYVCECYHTHVRHDDAITSSLAVTQRRLGPLALRDDKRNRGGSGARLPILVRGF